MLKCRNVIKFNKINSVLNMIAAVLAEKKQKTVLESSTTSTTLRY